MFYFGCRADLPKSCTSLMSTLVMIAGLRVGNPAGSLPMLSAELEVIFRRS